MIASIFVNPTQFGPREDFTRYPRTLDADLALLASAGCDLVLIPQVDAMYPGAGTPSAAPLPDAKSQTEQWITVDPGPMGDLLEGSPHGGRPGHFRGVCTVVAKLLNMTQPTHLLLGQKDFQQQAILRKMIEHLNFPVEAVTSPTLRETDGLAMSSRNRYLSAQERSQAPALFEALQHAKSLFDAGERRAPVLDAAMHGHLKERGLSPVYALAADAKTLMAFGESPGQTIERPAVLLIAAKLGNHPPHRQSPCSDTPEKTPMNILRSRCGV